MTLLLGPPGSGKTTLLKALTGRIKRDRYTQISVRWRGAFVHTPLCIVLSVKLVHMQPCRRLLHTPVRRRSAVTHHTPLASY